MDLKENILLDELCENYKTFYENYKDYRYRFDKREHSIKESSWFFPLVGKYYNESEIKLMVIGRCVNDWRKLKSRKDFNTKDVKNLAKTEILRKSINEEEIGLNWLDEKYRYIKQNNAFWSCIKCIIENLFKNNLKAKWYEYIVWSNLYFVSPSKSNQSDTGIKTSNTSLKKIQLDYAKNILEKQIQYFKPTHILFITDSEWFNDFSEKFSNIAATNNEIVILQGKQEGKKIIVTIRPDRMDKKRPTVKNYSEVVIEAFEKI